MIDSFSLVYLPIKAPTHEQNNLNNTNTTKHIYRVPVIIYNTSNTVFCVGDAMTHHEGQNNYYFPDHHNVPYIISHVNHLQLIYYCP